MRLLWKVPVERCQKDSDNESIGSSDAEQNDFTDLLDVPWVYNLFYRFLQALIKLNRDY